MKELRWQLYLTALAVFVVLSWTMAVAMFVDRHTPEGRPPDIVIETSEPVPYKE